MLTLVGILSLAKSHWREAVIAGLFMLACVLDLDANHWHKIADQRATTIAQVQVAQKAAQVAAQAAHDTQEQRYKDLANAADKNHAAALADADDATERYIAAHRVPACPASRPAGSSVASASGGGAASPVRPDPAPVMVAASEDDIRICTGNTLRLEAAQDWAAGLNQ